jgi:hypothetical protein
MCEDVPTNTNILECREVHFTKMDWKIKDGKFFCNDFYFGDVIFSDEKIVQVECKNKGKLTHGQIFTFNRNIQ